MLLKNMRFLLTCAFIVLFMAACQKAKDLDTEPASVTLSAPTANSVITAVSDEQQLAIELKGNVDANQVRVALNGEDITPDLRVSSMRLFALLKDLSQYVQRGDNYVDVKVLGTSINKTFRFFLDDQAPRIQVVGVIPAQPIPGNSVYISGNIIDVSPVQTLVFDANGTKRTATITGQAPNQTFTVALPYPNRKDPAYTPNDPINPNNSFDPEAHWVTNKADFTYTIVDSRGQKTTGQWVVPESRFERAAEMFLSHFAFNPVERLLNSVSVEVKKTLDFAENTFDSATKQPLDPLFRAWPSGSPGYPNANPNNNPINPSQKLQPGVTQINYATCDADLGQVYCPSQLDLANVPPQLPPTVANFLVPIDTRGGPGYCSAMIFDQNKVDTCAIYITAVEVTAPTVDFSWNKDSEKPQLDAAASFKNITLRVQIVGLQYVNGTGTPVWNGSNLVYAPGIENGTYTYQGRLKTNMKFDGLTLTTGFKVTAGNVYQPNLNQFVPNIKTRNSNGDLVNDIGRVISMDIIDASNTTWPLTYTVQNYFVNEQAVATDFVNQIQNYVSNNSLNVFVVDKMGSFTVQPSTGYDVANLNNISLDTNAKLLRFERIPGIDSSLSNVLQNLLDEERPVIYGTDCDVCDVKVGNFDVSVDAIEWFYNYNLIKVDGESIGAMIMSNIEVGLEGFAGDLLNQGVAGLEKSLNEFAFKNTLFPPTAPPSAPSTRSIQFDVSATSAKTVKAPLILGGYGRGGRFVFDGKIQTKNPDASKPAAIGFDFEKQFGFDDWMFYDKLFASKKPNDFSLALSANIINQYFVSAYETGLFDEYSLDFSGAEFSGNADLTSVASDQFTLSIELLQAPSVKLVPFQKQISYGGCVEFQGMGNCGSGGFNKVVQQEIPEQVAINIPGAKVLVMNTTTMEPLLEVTADITLGALVKGSGLKPKVEFSKVRVVNVATFAADTTIDPRFRNARAGAALQVALNNLGAKAYDLLRISPRTLDADDFFGTDFSDFLTEDASNNDSFALPMEIGLRLSELSVDKGGDYVTIAGNFVSKKVALCTDTPTEINYVTALCIEK